MINDQRKLRNFSFLKNFFYFKIILEMRHHHTENSLKKTRVIGIFFIFNISFIYIVLSPPPTISNHLLPEDLTETRVEEKITLKQIPLGTFLF